MEDDNKKNADCQIVCFDVYVIWCKITNRFYVGVTKQKPVYTRIRQHKRGKQLIDLEIQAIGWEGNFDWWIVEKHVPSTIITEREQYWIATFNSVSPHGYNKTFGGIGNTTVSENTRQKMSKSHTGKKLAPFTEEHKANISKSRTGEKNPNFGKPAWNRGIPCPEETKNKISDTLTGRERPDQSERMKGENNPNFGKHLSEETKDKLRAKALERDVSGENNPMYGKHHTEKAKDKISKANTGKPSPNKGKPLSQETKDKLRAKALERDISGENNPFYGKHHTEESKEKNRQAHLGKPSPRKGVQLSEETKAKIRATKAAKRAAKENAATQEITS